MINYRYVPAAPGWFAAVVDLIGEGSDSRCIATVRPIAFWVAAEEAKFVNRGHGEVPVTTAINMYPAVRPLRIPGLDDGPNDELRQTSLVLLPPKWHAVFGPGENPLPWAERWEEANGRKIDEWDVSDWWPSKSPVFATADETLWSNDFVEGDEE